MYYQTRYIPRYLALVNPGIEGIEWFVSDDLEQWDYQMTGQPGTGNTENNNIMGNNAANLLIGLGGNDTLNGGVGNDTMVGGTGDDFYYVNATGDVITEGAGEGSDSVLAAANYTLSANVENLTLEGAQAPYYHLHVPDTNTNGLVQPDGAGRRNGHFIQ